MLIIIKKYLINLSKCDPVAVSGWFSCTTRSLDHFTCTTCCKIVHSCSTECRNKITGIIMKVVRSLHEVERLSSNPNYCVSDLCLPFKRNIQNIIILPPVLRMHSSGTHCTVIRSSLHRKQLFRFIWIIIHLPWLHFPRIVGGESETGTNFSFLAALWYLRWIGMLIFTFMDPSLCTKNENNNNCRCPLYISGYSYSSKNTFCVYYIIVLLYFTKGRGDLAPQPLPLRGPGCVFHCEDLLYI